MLSKTTPPQIKALYHEAMDIYATTTIANVFASEITMVVVPQPDTTRHDIWFYRFASGPDRFAVLTQGGNELLMESVLMENRVLNCMKGLPHVFTDARDVLSQLECKLPWRVAMGLEELPRTAHRKPMPERRHKP
jgi:hypothetical protein